MIGALHGALCSSVLWLASLLPANVARLLWQVGYVAAGGWLAHRLNVFDRLEGNYASLAWAILLVCLLSGALFGFLAGTLQPSGSRPSWLTTQVLEHPRARVRWTSGLLATVAVLVTADRTLFIRTYPDAHFALRLAALWLAMVAAACILPLHLRDTSARVRRIVAAGLAAISFACVFTMDDGRQSLLNDMLARPYPAIFLRGLRALSDVDRDGYSSLLGGGDCDWSNAQVHPGHMEIPGNGQDDNCLRGDGHRLSSGGPPSEVPVPSQPSPLSVVLVTLDAVRADHTSIHGYHRDTTPQLRDWAKELSVSTALMRPQPGLRPRFQR